MPLDVDQYNVRRVYRNGLANLVTVKTKRDPLTNAIIGKESVTVMSFKYSHKSITQADVKILGDLIQRISKKIEIRYNQKFYELDLSQYDVKIDNVHYNIRHTETNFGRNHFLYLEAVTSKREGTSA